MYWAFGRLVLIFSFSVITIGIGVFAFRQVGLNSTYADIDHPLLNKKTVLIADGGDTDFGPDQSPSALKAAASLPLTTPFDGPIFLGIHLRLTQDGHWILYRSKDLIDLTNSNGYVSHKSLQEIQKYTFKNSNEKILELEEALKTYPNNNWLIYIHQPNHPQLKTVFDLIEKYNLVERVILFSEFADTSSEIRSKNPRWLSGNSNSESGKSYFMSSMFLEPAMDLKADAFWMNRQNQRLFSELRRRKKLIILEFQNNALPLDDFYSALEEKMTNLAIVTRRPSFYLQTVAPIEKNH